MIIVAILFIWLIIRLTRATKNQKEKNALILRFFIIFLIITGALILFQYELNIKGFTDRTYGSDAAFYYQKSLDLVNGITPLSSIRLSDKPGYYIWGALIELSSFYKSVIWIKICNLLIFLHLLLSIYLILRKNKISARTALLAISIISICGILVWTTIRNLKDILIAFLMIESILVWENYFESKRDIFQKIKLLIYLGIIFLILSTLRAFFIFAILAISIYYILKFLKSRLLKITFTLIVIFVSILVAAKFYSPVVLVHEYKISTEYVLQRESSTTANFIKQISPPIRLLFGAIRYVILPVPFKYLKTLTADQSAKSYFTGFSDNFWKLESSFLWWLLLPFTILGTFNRKYWKNRAITALGIWTFLSLLVYGFMFVGVVDCRQKIPLYIFGIILSVMKIKDSGIRKVSLYFPVGGFILIIIGLWWTLH